MRTTLDLSTVPLGVLIAIGALLVLEIALMVTALVSLARRPVAAVALGNKWVWVAFIVLINPIGAILYFVIGRKPLVGVEPVPAAPKRSSAEIAAELYAPDDTTGRP